MTAAEYRIAIQKFINDLRVPQEIGDGQLYAVHYTKPHVPRLLLQDAGNNRMRQYDGDYMNDPEEGRYLIDVIIQAAQSSNHPLEGDFVERLMQLRRAPLLYPAYSRATFLSCWTLTTIKRGKEMVSDSLNHWRFYGEDGTGACLMIPLKSLRNYFGESLYYVKYGTEMRGGGTGAENRIIRNFKNAIQNRLGALSLTRGTAMRELEEVIRETHPMLFMFKSSDYVAESEVRSVRHTNSYGNASGVELDAGDPRRAFIAGDDGLIVDGSIIQFGPKADKKLAIEVMHHAAQRGINVKVFVSTKPYR